MSQDPMDEVAAHNASADELHVEPVERESDAPVLESALLARIHQLNLDYLELLIAECDTPQVAAQSLYLPQRQRTALAALSLRALRALASMPYTLYSLGFEDENFWGAVCTNATGGIPAPVLNRYAGVGDASAQYAFCKVALIHAWHVAATNMMAARVVYAMPHGVAKQVMNMPLWQLRYVAASYRVLMTPRWPTNPAFWPDLIRFAGIKDMRRLRTTCLLGTQLIAAELEASCVLSRRDPRNAPAVASPRLRARKLQMGRHGR